MRDPEAALSESPSNPAPPGGSPGVARSAARQLAPSRAVVLRRVAIAVVVGVSVLVLVGLGVARAVGQVSLADVQARVQPGWILLSTVFIALGVMVQGPRVRALLPKDQRALAPGAASLGSLYLGATVLNLSFPGPAGEVAVAVVLEKVRGVRAVAALAASLHARFLALLSGTVVTLLALPTLDAPPELISLVRLAAGAVGLVGLGVALLSFQPKLLAAMSTQTAGRLAALPGRLGGVFRKLDVQVKAFAWYLGQVPRQGVGPMAVAVVWTFVGHVALTGATLTAAWGLGVYPELWGAFLTQSVALVAALALVIVPGGLGAFDLAVVGTLMTAGGLGPADAALTLLGIRMAQVLSLGVSAAVFLGWARALLTSDVVAAMDRGMLPPDETDPPAQGASDSEPSR